MPFLTGSYTHTVDQQNRLFIPAKLREQLGERFYSYIPINGMPCIMLFGEEQLQEMLRRLNEDFSGDRFSAAQRKMFQNLQEVTPDKQGRVTLHPKFRKRADQEKEAQINGVGSYAEIWRPAAEDEAEAPDPAFEKWTY